ncbi:hypothetical protein WICPIJ_008018 [Wickerhamomyces pijperi]|uniref:Actin-related protein 4 n=1 Tax=Wickerhamomyces pijperi TaxID=599730 RepID=A0A9P8Q0K6_WICPI|nr:hypothetical protein WICPIJ_008018 [Wickerhamomyces pijperi]
MAQSNSVLQVYGGDPGSHTTKAGYAGEDTPRLIVPSYVRVDELSEESMSKPEEDPKTNDEETKDTRFRPITKRSNYFYGETAINYPKENAEIKPIVKDGVIEDWDSAMEQWEYMFDQLQVDYAEQPLLMTEPVWNPIENRKKSLEVALETFQFPGFYLSAQPSCSAFALGRPCALVVDIGYDTASVTPVIDGMVLAKSTLKTHYAGRYLSKQVLNQVIKRTEPIPLYKVKSKVFANLDNGDALNWQPKPFANITKSYDDYQVEKIIHDIKETALSAPATDTPLDKLKELTTEEMETNFHTKLIELPNGAVFKSPTIINMEITSSLFNPGLYQDDEFQAESGEPEIQSRVEYVPLKRTMKKADDPSAVEEETETSKAPAAKKQKTKDSKEVPKVRGIGALASHSLSLVDVDLRTQLANNVIVTGSTSLIPGVTDYLNHELSLNHPGLKFRLHASGNTVERKYQTWIGGSILASLGTFHQLWVNLSTRLVSDVVQSGTLRTDNLTKDRSILDPEESSGVILGELDQQVLDQIRDSGNVFIGTDQLPWNGLFISWSFDRFFRDGELHGFGFGVPEGFLWNSWESRG